MVFCPLLPIFSKRIFCLLIVIMGFAFFVTSCSFASKPKQMKTVSNFDLNRYAGTWYEIARFPHRFEKDLVGVTATYNIIDNKRIEVINQGYKYTLDGEKKRAIGKARIPDHTRPGHLRVSFFLFFYADYYILELDQTNYQYALIGSSSDKYLWILGRSSQMNNEIYEMLVTKARELGYDVNRLERVLQRE